MQNATSLRAFDDIEKIEMPGVCEFSPRISDFMCVYGERFE
jgi:hypothetical protein